MVLAVLMPSLHSWAAAPVRACPFASDAANDSWPAGFVGATGSAASGNLDLLRLELSSTSSTITARITLRDLSQADPATALGVQYDVRAVVAMKRIHLDAVKDATGTTYYAFAENLDEGTGEPSTVQLPGTSVKITGSLDPKTSTITLHAPLKAFGFLRPLQPGRELKSWYAAAYRMLGTYPSGGSDVPGDHLSTAKVYKLADRSCGRF
jgi:hypothetical protein